MSILPNLLIKEKDMEILETPGKIDTSREIIGIVLRPVELEILSKGGMLHRSLATKSINITCSKALDIE
jgi:hypothetical protein